MRRLPVVLLCASLFACASTKEQAKAPAMPDLPPAAPGTLTVGMNASTSSAAVQAQSQAFAAFVKQATGKETRPAVFPDYDSLANALAKGVVDVAFIPPLAFVRAQGQAKVLPLLMAVRSGQSTYRSVIFTGPKATVKTLDDLKKAKSLKAAWVDSSSSTGYIFPKALLIQKGIDPQGLFVSQDFLGNHDAVCKAVFEGTADLGATFSDDPASGDAKTVSGCKAVLGDDAAKLTVVAATENIPNDVLAVREGLPDDVRAALAAKTQDLEKTDEGKKTLKDAFKAEGFTSVGNEDFGPVSRALDAFKQ